jgi:hypothetical protein
VNEMLEAMQLLKIFVAQAWAAKNKKTILEKDLLKTGETLLKKNKDEINKLEIQAEGFENSRRKVVLHKVPEAYRLYSELVTYYGTIELIGLIERKKITSWADLIKALPSKPLRKKWKNAGGLLMTEDAVKTLMQRIRRGSIGSWDEVHNYYAKKSHDYKKEKSEHAFASLLEVLHIPASRFTKKLFIQLIKKALATHEWMTLAIFESRAKDYKNPFRKMVYETEKEMEKVLGKLSENSFIRQQQTELDEFRKKIDDLLKLFS